MTLHRSLDDAEVAGSRTLLSRLAANLIDNAIRYNQPGGWVHVTTTTEGPTARLTVENSGPVLDPAEVDQLGRPFRRGGAERTCSDGGVGLGLSIVAAIAAAHHGTDRARRPPRRRDASGGHASPLDASSPRSRVAMRVLVVEDVRRLADDIAEGLRDQGMAVDVAYTGLDAAAKLDINRYDVVVLDRDLPGIHGDTICKMITDRDDPAMVLMLTAADAPADRVSGLGLGADDYLPKPFHFPELVLRLRALARRKPTAQPRTLKAVTSSSTRSAGPPPGPASRAS